MCLRVWLESFADTSRQRSLLVPCARVSRGGLWLPRSPSSAWSISSDSTVGYFPEAALITLQ